MAYQVRNIIIGAAALYISKSDSTTSNYTAPTLPAAPGAGQSFSSALDGASTDWRHAGFTTEGLEISYEPDFGDVEVDQLLDSAKLFKQSMKVTVNTTLAEASLENLLVAWGQSATTLTSSGTENTLGIAAGALGDEPVERSLVAVGPGPRAADGAKRERIYHARRVLSVEASAHSVKRNEATVFPVAFRLLPDPNFAGQEYGVIRDRNV
ncbi:major tail protein [Streptomyces phage BillNye]|uniref:Major tail protein n=2 Tax=Wilnyevirus billnye TaxID=2560486 RepID=A0A2L1IVP9_9CAUD|nr:protein with Ig domain [Streptomyces phage BillNye]AVD99233.1 major tail protein [Streptomyces phage BillNye]QBZ72317.1 major tail protein [Streptomyces phage Circinus]